MEGKYWNRDRDERNRYNRSPRQNRVDENMYRGAYRLDTTSDHRNQSTWDGFGSTERGHRQQGDYNQNYNRDYNRDYNRNYNQDTRNRGYDHDNYNTDSRYRDQGEMHYRSGNYADWNDKSHYRHSGEHRYNKPQHHPRSVHDRIENHDPYGMGNFRADYGPDPFGQGGGENYGNEAGSLSYGYDGTSNYDPDWNRRYNPLTGERQSYHGHYTSRNPEHWNNPSRDERY